VRIDLEYVEYRNILSVGLAPIRVSLNTHERTLVVGSNGAGKTTLMQAITFGLYGKSLGNLINKPDLLNEQNKSDLLVEIGFTRGSDRFVVRRGIKPNVFDILKNGIALDALASVADTQKAFEADILGMDFRTYSYIVALNSKNYVPFLRLKPEPRRQFIEEIHELEVFSEMKALLKKDSDAAEKAFTESKKEVDYLDGQIDNAETRLETLETEREKVIEDIEAELTDIQEKIDAAKARVELADIELREKEEAYNSLATKSHSAALADVQKLIASLGHKVDDARTQSKYFLDATVCNTCQQDIDRKFAKAKIAELDAKAAKSESTLREAEILQADLAAKNKAVSNAWDAVWMCRNQKGLIQGEVDHQEANKTAAEKRLKTARAAVKEGTSKVEDDITRLENERVTAQVRNDRHRDELNDLNSIAIMLKDTGIKATVIRKQVTVVNRLINQILKTLGADFRFEFDENFEATIKARHLTAQSYEAFSEGEKARIDIAIMLTWRELVMRRKGAELNVLFLDEVFDGSIDTDGISNLISVLNSLQENKTNVFIISHSSDMIEENFNRMIRFKKVGGFTQIEDVK
jgi:DNA repair exonuclease SbcCD ATPase subunit